MLTGYKTYIVVAAMIIYAVVVHGIYQGDWNAAVQLILEALALLGIRFGVKTAAAGRPGAVAKNK